MEWRNKAYTTVTVSEAEPRAEEIRRSIGSLEAILFDLDGTAIDTQELILESFRYSTRTLLGRVIPDKELMAKVGQPITVQMADFDSARVDELTYIYREHNAIHHDELIKPFPFMNETLQVFKDSGIPMGVVTSKKRSVAMKGLTYFNLGGYFDTVIGADDVEFHKPDPYPLFEGAKRMGVELSRCIYIGDSPYDMQAAIAGGAISVAALWGMFPRDAVLEPNPDFELSSIIELPKLVNMLRN